jgi:hypothetical protein
MSRLIAPVLVLLLLFTSVPFATAQLTADSRQWSKGDFKVDSKVIEKNLAQCTNPSEKKDGNKHVRITADCTELAGVPADRKVKLEATLIKKLDGGREKKIRDCKDVYRTTGTPGEFQLECRIRLPKAAR